MAYRMRRVVSSVDPRKGYKQEAKFLRLDKHATKVIAKISGVILNYSGTLVDAHAVAAALAFQRALQAYGVEIPMNDARHHVHLRRDIMFKQVLQRPTIARQWKHHHKRLNIEADAKRINDTFLPIQSQILSDEHYTTLLPGVKDTLNCLKSEFGNMSVGLTTRFHDEHSNVIAASIKKQGIELDSRVSACGELFQRPKPHMIFQNMMNMDIYPVESLIKVDATTDGIKEGINAGVWTVGLYGASPYTDVESIEAADIKQANIDKSKDILMRSGAHYLAQDLTSLPAIIDDINNQRLAKGELPQTTQQVLCEKSY